MKNFLNVGVAFFIIDAVIILINGIMTSARFGRYLEEKYPKEYHALAYENSIKKSLRIPWQKNSISHFVWISNDDLGDPRIAIFRKKIKWSFYGFLLNGLAAIVFFGVIAFLLALSNR
jgi:hypothetical protein